jgi:hypothetical protein
MGIEGLWGLRRNFRAYGLVGNDGRELMGDEIDGLEECGGFDCSGREIFVVMGEMRLGDES